MHKSVLLKETIDNLEIKDDLIYVDATLGYAGHSREVLKRIKKGFLFAFDQDSEAIQYSEKILSNISNQYEIVHSNFVNIKKELTDRGIAKIDGIMFDLGISSPQLDNEERGFSYHQDARLDMRMNREDKLSAYEIVNNYSVEELLDIFFKYGEEKYARSIAKKIIEYRTQKPIETTLELVEVIKSGVPDKYKRAGHPARKVFQAIRIEVNHELDILEKSLEDAIDLLNEGGRICVITFHSLEDKICKSVFKKYSDVPEIVKGLPNIPDEYKPTLKLIGRYVPSDEELNINNRARSATLRVAEKIRRKD
ncbi:MAG: 16S rRNA (cytosine(1402)-N(4))-methyltransferase RsmH [Bacilli bacterium]|nr:16S rRNA (cytosine(1402)-N(4))-methyltransferase RsmH [Bacilli bacterium]MDD3304922.1 16S rRNA (cytosine(1402)-N(4))-methyltransferase RsmH [Bacilli bacterium]MDD4053743.1 16S rRNA (cytosine(1402)-N(4))-methyltransferase RsmH [Bacilli bacterium]MDD4411597.1 16S rRNA (cytosine(1402)-N(4))-methyltransferase RsmH [Bacilli bacterium]